MTTDTRPDFGLPDATVTSNVAPSSLSGGASVAAHTPGPWHLREGHPTQISSRLFPGEVLAETMLVGTTGRIAQMEANAARIVACVNACEGIDNPAEWVESSKTFQRELVRRGELMAKAADDLDALRSRCESLEAALRRVVELAIAKAPRLTTHAHIAEARALLSNLKEQP